MANLTEKAAILSFGNILIRFSAVLSGIVVVRLLTQEHLGSFRQVNLIFNTCNMVLLLGISSSIYFLSQKQKSMNSMSLVKQHSPQHQSHQELVREYFKDRNFLS